MNLNQGDLISFLTENLESTLKINEETLKHIKKRRRFLLIDRIFREAINLLKVSSALPSIF